jgi:hypothetical protein
LTPESGASIVGASWYPAHGAAFTLQELQGAVGGYIEAVRMPASFWLTDVWPCPPEQVWLVLNEDGKRLQLPVNPIATALLRMAGSFPGDVAVGVCVLATHTEMGAADEDAIEDQE